MSARIVVIEDNQANLDLMTYLLCAFGYQTQAAKDGEEGLELVRRERPDLVVCDVQLPKMDGDEVVRLIKEDPEFAKMPVIAVTALAMVGDRDRILAAGFDGYISKPIDPTTFVPRIEEFLGLEGRREAVFGGETQPHVRPESSNAKRILVVDNQPVNLDLARSVLEPFGYKVFCAEGVHEGLRLALQFLPDLILSDVAMGDGTGYDFIELVKREPALASIPFIFITSTMQEERYRTKGMKLGAARFFFRPMEPRLLLEEIAACLEP
ncbi:MAG: response regulator [Planctomycetota bacterium]